MFDHLTKLEIISTRSKLYRDIRQEESAMSCNGLRADVAKASLVELRKQLAAIEKLSKKRRIP